MEDLVKSVMDKGIVSDIENKIDEYDAIIQNERKGLKNLLRGWGGGSTKKSRAGDNYTQDSIDWKLMRYANILFMLKVLFIIFRIMKVHYQIIKWQKMILNLNLFHYMQVMHIL